MDKLVYGDFIWPQNPDRYEQRYTRKPVYEKNSAGDMVFQGMSPLKRTITGGGTFSGTAAGASFLRLAALCGQAEPKNLTHPVWGTVSAYLTELEMEQEPRENFVTYRFTFQAADENGHIPQ